MNIIFLTLGRLESIESHSIYADLLRSFRNHGHNIYAICPCDEQKTKKTELICEKGSNILRIKTGYIKGSSNLLNKGIAQLLIEPKYINAIKTYYSQVKFDLVMYSTPPITFNKVVEYIKKRDGAISYLLLKDIFPQNAVDLNILTKKGIKGLAYHYFRNQEKKLYMVSDYIGCMSPANVEYILNNNKYLSGTKVEVCPNCIEIIDKSLDDKNRKIIRKKYGLPLDKRIFLYGGNLGKPQGISFLVNCLKEIEEITDVFFVIIGQGSEQNTIQKYIETNKPRNVLFLQSLPKDEYDNMVGACDVGLVFLDYRFSIPNFPSRLLAYMQAKIPILAVTDKNTDMGRIIVDNQFGWWCESNDSDSFKKKIISIIKQLSESKYNAEKEFEFLKNNYNVEKGYDIIMQHFSGY